MTDQKKVKKPNSRRNLDLAIQREFPSAEDPTRPRTALADAVLACP